MILQCRICSKEKSAADFYKRDSGSFRTECKECTIIYAAARRLANKQRIDFQYKPEKKCNGCNATLSTSLFGKADINPDGLKSRCKKCESKSSQRYYGRNRDSRIEANKRWASKNRDLVNEIQAKWKQKNIGKARECARKATHRWRKKNPHQVIYQVAQRRSAKIQATVKWADKEKIKQIYADAARISIETGIKHHVDHIIPLRNKLVCGLHVPENLRVITATENLSKRNSFQN